MSQNNYRIIEYTFDTPSINVQLQGKGVRLLTGEPVIFKLSNGAEINLRQNEAYEEDAQFLIVQIRLQTFVAASSIEIGYGDALPSIGNQQKISIEPLPLPISITAPLETDTAITQDFIPVGGEDESLAPRLLRFNGTALRVDELSFIDVTEMEFHFSTVAAVSSTSVPGIIPAGSTVKQIMVSAPLSNTAEILIRPTNASVGGVFLQPGQTLFLPWNAATIFAYNSAGVAQEFTTVFQWKNYI